MRFCSKENLKIYKNVVLINKELRTNCKYPLKILLNIIYKIACSKLFEWGFNYLYFHIVFSLNVYQKFRVLKIIHKNSSGLEYNPDKIQFHLF